MSKTHYKQQHNTATTEFLHICLQSVTKCDALNVVVHTNSNQLNLLSLRS